MYIYTVIGERDAMGPDMFIHSQMSSLLCNIVITLFILGLRHHPFMVHPGRTHRDVAAKMNPR
jgi:hypothetical protein